LKIERAAGHPLRRGVSSPPGPAGLRLVPGVADRLLDRRGRFHRGA
jgi:hypothetical protein